MTVVPAQNSQPTGAASARSIAARASCSASSQSPTSLENVPLRARGCALDLLGVLVDSDDGQRGLAGLEHRADVFGVAATRAVYQVSRRLRRG